MIESFFFCLGVANILSIFLGALQIFNPLLSLTVMEDLLHHAYRLDVNQEIIDSIP